MPHRVTRLNAALAERYRIEHEQAPAAWPPSTSLTT